MNTKRLISLLWATCVAIFINACSQQDTSNSEMRQNVSIAKMPEVNDENCKFENIKAIKDKAMREAFADSCFLRGEYKPSPKKDW